MRLQLAREVETLLASGTLSDKDANYARFCLDNAFDGSVAFWGVFLMPLQGAWVVAGLRARRASPVDPITDLFCRSALVSNPLCGTIVFVQMAVISAIGVLVTGQLRSVKSLVRAVVDAENAVGEPLRFGARAA
jgi:hypothetical protein